MFCRVKFLKILLRVRQDIVQGLLGLDVGIVTKNFN